LIGLKNGEAYIMSTTLATLLVELFPEWKIQISERRNGGAQESCIKFQAN
jgi:L-2-hydroxyglutarate oxidase LhgO